jgi:hypothetical protein
MFKSKFNSKYIRVTFDALTIHELKSWNIPPPPLKEISKLLHDQLLKFNDFIRKNGILLENEKKLTYITNMNLISEIEETMENASNRINLGKSYIDKNFRILNRILRVSLFSFESSMYCIDVFIELNGTNMAHFNTLIENLEIMNKSLQELRDSPAWNEILEINSRSFKCETGWLKNKTMSPYKESFDQYTQLAMCFELDDPDLKVIVDNILDPVKFNLCKT